MRNMKLWLPLIIFLIVVGFFWKGLREDPTKVPSPLINKAAPQFASESLLNPKQQLTNQIFQGHVSLLNVWASWCYACRSETDTLKEIVNSKTVTVIGMDYKDQRSEALAWLDREGDPYSEIISDPTGDIGINYGVYGTPETFVIDKNGIIRYKYIGPISPSVWKDDILPVVLKWQRG